jgi:hypothetical protein
MSVLSSSTNSLNESKDTKILACSLLGKAVKENASLEQISHSVEADKDVVGELHKTESFIEFQNFSEYDKETWEKCIARVQKDVRQDMVQALYPFGVISGTDCSCLGAKKVRDIQLLTSKENRGCCVHSSYIQRIQVSHPVNSVPRD